MLRGRILKTGNGRQECLAGPRFIVGQPGCLTLVVLLLLLPSLAGAVELQTRYATIHYDSEKQLHKLNRELVLSRNLAYLLRRRKIMTVNDEVAAKIDIILEQVQVALEMVPAKLTFDLLLFSTARDAQQELFNRYRKKVDFISFYSRRENVLYLSAKHSKLRVVAHELAHVVVEHYFDRSPPAKIHEVMAQYAASHIAE